MNASDEKYFWEFKAQIHPKHELERKARAFFRKAISKDEYQRWIKRLERPVSG